MPKSVYQFDDEVEVKEINPIVVPPPPLRPPKDIDTVISNNINEISLNAYNQSVEHKSTDIDINEYKKELKRIQNRRAIFIASKLSGDSQDSNLKESENTLKRLESEISKFRIMQSRDNIDGIHINNLKSEFYKFDVHKDAYSRLMPRSQTMIQMEDLLESLESDKNILKNKVFRFIN